MKLFKKTIAAFLIAIMAFLSVSTKAGAAENAELLQTVYDNVAYTCSIVTASDGTKNLTIKASNGSYDEIVLNDSYVHTTHYDSNNEITSNSIIYLDNENGKNYSPSVSINAAASSITYSSAVYEDYKDKYFYQRGVNGSKVYYKIGNSSTTYLLNVTSYVPSDFTDYKAAITSINTNYKVVLGASAFATAAAIIALAATLAAGPLGLALSALGLEVTGATAVATAALSILDTYGTLNDKYINASSHGTKQ